MTQEQAKALLPIIQAYSEGKTIEYLTTRDEWVKLEDPGFNYNVNRYRIKSEPKYRPFKDADECFEEMKKHEPFGWIKNKALGYNTNIYTVDTKSVGFGFGSTCQYSYREIFDKFTFADGSLFGVKEE